MTDTPVLPVYQYFINEFPKWTVILEDRRSTDDQSIEITLSRPGYHNFECDDLRFVTLLIRSRLMIAAFSTYVSADKSKTAIDIRLVHIPICLILPTI
ncbi:hypothetical protein [Spirosoma fluviale]|uniref:Uncharacterized protein n=1 Tax=Spirosoma fluviale TaxID=1597977 RepID=A0A286F6Q9_9BACT|nr:hypothetical protein [Spirosoma fluviale]SOD78873.1 hypothetical protein SAMN06269250_0684 [Spirosoma fluviale]